VLSCSSTLYSASKPPDQTQRCCVLFFLENAGLLSEEEWLVGKIGTVFRSAQEPCAALTSAATGWLAGTCPLSVAAALPKTMMRMTIVVLQKLSSLLFKAGFLSIDQVETMSAEDEQGKS
jgi:hypothetical protein